MWTGSVTGELQVVKCLLLMSELMTCRCPGDQGLPVDGSRLYTRPRRRSRSDCLGIRRSAGHCRL